MNIEKYVFLKRYKKYETRKNMKQEQAKTNAKLLGIKLPKISAESRTYFFFNSTSSANLLVSGPS